MDLNDFFLQIRKRAIEESTAYIENLSNKAFDLVQQKTPVDTENLSNHIKKSEVVVYRDTVQAQVYVDPKEVEYANMVEWGNGGRSRNWHMRDGTIYTNPEGALMFTRTQNEINNLMKQG